MNRNSLYDVRRPGIDGAGNPPPHADYPLVLLTRRAFAATAGAISSQRDAAPHRIAFRHGVTQRPPKPS